MPLAKYLESLERMKQFSKSQMLDIVEAFFESELDLLKSEKDILLAGQMAEKYLILLAEVREAKKALEAEMVKPTDRCPKCGKFDFIFFCTNPDDTYTVTCNWCGTQYNRVGTTSDWKV
jgi:formate dehydrogenase maturation protein FdhE